MHLESLGADSAIFGAFQTYAAQGLILGRVATAQRDQYRLYTEIAELPAEPSGALWYRAPDRASMPVVGDWVAARMVASEQAIVEAVLPRRSCFSRRAAGRREEEQPLAANIDLVFLVCGLDGDFNLRRIERYLTLAAESGASPVVVLNKADVCDHLPARLAETAAVAGGAPVVPLSARQGDGLDSLTAFLAPGRTVALLGSSGVGKSTIVNLLLGEERLRTAEVRSPDSRGRHTTTHRELVPLAQGGALIDTPGMRELQLWAGQESVGRAFEEIAEIGANCRYRDCSHSGEQGCAVAQALDDGSITRERWESYRKLLGEARRHEQMTDRLAAQEQKRKLKAMHRAQKEHYKFHRSGKPHS
ncbi:putative ribosome biogenesis GTPase RsgA 2 [Candidatus Sulfopaludibacter sp. SbA6]|nr:putative ribosome biogenesis GTPase RsgA 2 [Candidatus Sulfopaludibacter sp. SbA6]